MKSIISYSLIFILLALCATFAYMWVDRSISLSYANQSLSSSNAALNSIENLLGDSWKGMEKDTLVKRLQAEAAARPADSILVKEEKNVIWFGDVRFNIENGFLKNIGD
ncbi:Imm58 family immunity protein [Burkholderia lata]|uniref:Imm58 family immunity protein n=1 Tax=Burkholderia lata (strain ATCC 17760 / DSM 23089 / LMG 22485 / NCIMB 9086 / R18194 / 383) TaxID=482957 RepID=UPI001582CA43|nr:Imm58 family immunity protein [Burkholderia lata]